MWTADMTVDDVTVKGFRDATNSGVLELMSVGVELQQGTGTSHPQRGTLLSVQIVNKPVSDPYLFLN